MISRCVGTVAILHLLGTTGCSLTTKEEMSEYFQVGLAKSVGRTHKELQRRGSKIGDRQATEIRTLPNGNTLYEYRDYRGDKVSCDVFFEVDPGTDKVVAARSEGDDCYWPP